MPANPLNQAVVAQDMRVDYRLRGRPRSSRTLIGNCRVRLYPLADVVSAYERARTGTSR